MFFSFSSGPNLNRPSASAIPETNWDDDCPRTTRPVPRIRVYDTLQVVEFYQAPHFNANLAMKVLH